MKHPLLNKESKHYCMIDGVEAIERMEQMYSIEELKIWSKLTAMKYRLRLGHKDGIQGEATKIATYEAYYKFLEDKILSSDDLNDKSFEEQIKIIEGGNNG